MGSWTGEDYVYVGEHMLYERNSMLVCYWEWPRRHIIIDDGKSGHSCWKTVH